MKTNYSNTDMLDIIFEHRNKAFGAYILRREYNKAITKAMLITVSSVFLLCFGNFLRERLKNNANEIGHNIILTTSHILPAAVEKVKEKPPVTKSHIEPPAPKPSIKDVEMTTVKQAQAPDSVPNTFDIKTDPGLITSNPLKGNEIGTESGKGTGTVFDIEPRTEAVKGPLLFADTMPEYPGGEKALMKFLAENTHYPESMRDIGIGGKVVSQFTVNEDGTISDLKIVRSPASGFDREVLRVIKILKSFKPGKQDGKPVKVRFTLPFSFKTND